jgi:CRP/FNR family cyclic AMP-dependent transcriptional regulator
MPETHEKRMTAMDTDQKEMETFIGNLPIFSHLSLAEIAIVTATVQILELDAGQILFNEWEKAEYVCFVESGALDVMKKSGPETYSPIARLKRGRSIGEMSIIENCPRSVTVQVQQNARLVLFSRQAFEEILQSNPQVAVNILKGLAHLLSQNLKKTSSRLDDYLLPLG